MLPSISEEVLGLGVTVVLHLIDAISCTTADCLIWDFNLSEGDAWYKMFFLAKFINCCTHVCIWHIQVIFALQNIDV